MPAEHRSALRDERAALAEAWARARSTAQRRHEEKSSRDGIVGGEGEEDGDSGRVMNSDGEDESERELGRTNTGDWDGEEWDSGLGSWGCSDDWQGLGPTPQQQQQQHRQADSNMEGAGKGEECRDEKLEKQLVTILAVVSLRLFHSGRESQRGTRP